LPSKWIWLFSRVSRRIWFRATLFSIVGVATALLAIVVSPFIPDGLSGRIGADAVDNILAIIASSMLTVTTFSLSTMVSAYSAATSNVTPRATRLVMEDSTTQNVLATFVGSFLFSLVGIVALSTGAYGEQGRLVLFIVTVCVIILIVITLLRWIDHLSRLGRVTETTRRVEEATIKAIRAWRQNPNLGGRALTDAVLRTLPEPLYATDIGYVQHIDTAAISAIADGADIDIAIVAIPGKLVARRTAIAWANRPLTDEQKRRLAACFTVDDVRSFDQDPRFGASVLTEIASRALSSAINDPGTAIDVLSRSLRILAVWAETAKDQAEPEFPRLYVAPLQLSELFDDLFTLVARDGAGLVEVGVRLQKTLTLISRLEGDGFNQNALRHSQDALERAVAALVIPADVERLKRAALAPEVSGQ
jgi:uncharacterized membrane protein